jgi:hypothetical protein
MRRLWYRLVSWLAPRPEVEVPAYKSYSFIGRVSGDCECFCWDEVRPYFCVSIDEKGKTSIVEPNLPIQEGRLYPGGLLSSMGVRLDKRYKFIVMVSEVDS